MGDLGIASADLEAPLVAHLVDDGAGQVDTPVRELGQQRRGDGSGVEGGLDGGVAGEREEDVAGNALEPECLGLGLAGEVDLQDLLGVEEQTVGLEGVEVRRKLDDAPDLRLGCDRSAHVEGESARGGAHRPEVVELDAPVQVDDEGLQLDIDGDDDAAGHLDQRLVEQAEAIEFDSAGETDLEIARLADDLEAVGRRGAGRAGFVGPGPGLEGDGDEGLLAGIGDVELAVDVVADGVAVVQEGVGAGEGGGTKGGAGKGDFIPVDGGGHQGGAARRSELNVHPGLGVLRNLVGDGHNRRSGLCGGHSGTVDGGPSVGNQGCGNGARSAEVAGQPVTVGGVAEANRRGGTVKLRSTQAAAGEGEFGGGVDDGVMIQRLAGGHREGDIQIPALVEQLDVDLFAGGGIDDGGGGDGR